ncbi:MAG: hypothetical protein HKO67_04960, partial [Flavobacteriaceae bacterium]|nr:hypothetical protein [Flavobacteriaceae bacterium]
EEATGTDYPNLMFVHGHIPQEAPEISFEGEDLNSGDGGDNYNVDDYEDMDFDEQWN